MTALLVVDTETGGLDPVEACIISIAAQVLVIEPGKVEFAGEYFESKIKPDRPVGPAAAKVNGYTPEAWADAPEPAEALAAFRHWTEARCKEHDKPMWCGCNPLFDLKFYNSDRKRHGQAEPHGLGYRVIDVQSMAIPLLFLGEVDSVSLSALRAWAGIDGEQSHTALGDVLDTCEVIGALLLRGSS